MLLLVAWLLLEDCDAELALLDELLDDAAEELAEDEVPAAGPTEHQAESGMALPPLNRDLAQVKLPVSVA
ncbi:MAG: hypothetical protein BSR46_05620 [Candidatus Dactylopiibacterium carminicum]|nr:MAG: hypothetical protein BSR46_05620 [Candidatus Dactylopiibacterium carminicum]